MALNSTEWITSLKNDTIRKEGAFLQVDEHPLKTLIVTERIPRRILGSQPSTGRTTPVSTPTTLLDLSAALEGIDPLSKFAIEELDPLTQIANENAMKSVSNVNSSKKSHDLSKYNLESWDSRKIGILNRFTTSEKISIVTSFLSDDEKVIVKAQTSQIDKVQHRLEQLDYFEEGSQRKFDLSQVEYVHRIAQLNKELVTAWNSEQRVKALKIAIQCAKLLADTDVFTFYPSKFVLITDILDIFGQLVYHRLRTKADYIKPGSRIATALPDGFTPEMVSELTKETCRNWFYKIASIRELVPRIYVEMAILKSYSFLTSSEYIAALLRITRMIRGIGNPLVSVYARCYLCRVGLTVLTDAATDNKYLVENFYDFLNLYNQLFGRGAKQEINKQKLDIPQYLTLYTPALDFILQAVASGASEIVLTQILDRCQQQGNSSLLLNTIMAAFKPSYISVRSIQFLEIINKSTDNGFPVHVLLRTLGLCVTVCPPLNEQRKQVLNTVWRRISKIKNPEHYINCAEPWVQYAVQYFMNREGEINVILGDIIQHMTPDRAHEKFYPQLKAIVEKIILHTQDIEALLSMDQFMPLIDLFQQETTRVEISKIILIACDNYQPTSDAVIINSLKFLCSILHDSVNALTVEDETRQIGDIICNIIRRVDYGRDFEQQLSFYVEARGAYNNIDAILAQLVQCVNALSVQTRSVVNGNHTRKTGAFVRACAAYCFITIPSIGSVRSRLELYLLSGRVALFNNCLGQADACFKTALSIIPELASPEEQSRTTETYLVTFIKEFLSTLLIVPDSPDKGVLNLTRALLNIMQHFEWDPQHTNMAYLYLNVLDMLSVMAQDKYPYYVEKVDSNDKLYGSDPKFIGEINKICTIILGELLGILKQLGPGRKQSALAIELMSRIINRTQLNKTNPMPTLAYNLWQLSLKHGHADSKHAMRTKEYFARKAQTNEDPILQHLTSILNI